MKSFIEQQHLPIKKTAKIHTKGGMRNSVAKADRYFSSLSEDQVRKLYEIYKYDFQMFGYEYESYLQLASLNTNKKKNEFDLALEKVREEEKYERKKENKTQKFKQKKSNNRKGRVGGGKKKNQRKWGQWGCVGPPLSIAFLKHIKNSDIINPSNRTIVTLTLVSYIINITLSLSLGRMLLFFSFLF